MGEAMSRWGEQYRQFDSATVYEASGRSGAMNSAIKPTSSGLVACGPAYTVRCHLGDNLAIHRALLDVQPGQVLVVDAVGYTEAGYWGEVMTAAAQGRKVAGLVIDGGVRDVRSTAARGFPVFARGVCIKGTMKQVPGEVQVPVMCAGTLVLPGDLILADDDGVVVVGQERLAEVYEKCRSRHDSEARMMQLLEVGNTTTVDLLGLRAPLGIPGQRSSRE